MAKSAIVIGGGVAGITISHLLSEKGWDVTLLEKNGHLGGGFKTFYYGGHPYTYGPRPLISRNESETGVFEFVNKFTPLRKLDHNLLTYVEHDGQFYSYPIHEDDIPRMPDADKIYAELEEIENIPQRKPENFEEYWLGKVGPSLYEKFINTYSKKMWQVSSNKEITDFAWSPKGAALKSGPRSVSFSNENIIGYPYAHDGYDAYFEKATQDVKVRLNSAPDKYDLDKKRVLVNNEWISGDIIVNTISLDVIMNNAFGKLPYVGRDFIKLVLPAEEILPEGVQFIHYSGDEIYTRVVEYKKLTFHKSPTTLLVIEIPSSNGKLYPLPVAEPQALAQRYKNALPKDVYTIGRIGSYIYNIDFDGLIIQCFNFMKQLDE